MNARAESSTVYPQIEVPEPSARGARAFLRSPYFLTAIFFVVCLARILHHAMWRDELQAWSIARASANISELFRNFRYEGHPAGWFLILYAVTRLTTNPVAMQVLHACAATAM